MLPEPEEIQPILDHHDHHVRELRQIVAREIGRASALHATAMHVHKHGIEPIGHSAGRENVQMQAILRLHLCMITLLCILHAPRAHARCVHSEVSSRRWSRQAEPEPPDWRHRKRNTEERPRAIFVKTHDRPLSGLDSQWCVNMNLRLTVVILQRGLERVVRQGDARTAIVAEPLALQRLRRRVTRRSNSHSARTAIVEHPRMWKVLPEPRHSASDVVGPR